MPPITTEAEWHTCDDPWELGRYATGRINLQRFRWLAVDWGSRIRDQFTQADLRWFDSYTAWVNGVGPHPSKLNLPDNYEIQGYSVSFFCSELKHGNPLEAAVQTACSLIRDFDWPRLQQVEVVTFDQWEAWKKEIEAPKKRVCQEFCDQFRDVAGNPFRPVQIQHEWLSSTVVELTHCIHLEQTFDAMPLLSDALQDAGCDQQQILDHCRGMGQHVRGCWVLSLLTGNDWW